MLFSSDVKRIFEVANELRKSRLRSKRPSEHIFLRDNGFDLMRDNLVKGGVDWPEVDEINVFKEDMVTFDLVCMEFWIRYRDQTFEVNDDVGGFWELTKRIKEVFSTSEQRWEESVVKPAFARNATMIYKRDIERTD